MPIIPSRQKQVEPLPKIRLPQVRALMVLSEDGCRPLLTRAKLAERIGLSPISGTLSSVLNGVREGSSSGPARPGILSLGLAERFDIEVEGLLETVYQVTDKGERVLQQILDERGQLPELRDKDISTNKRYLGEEE